MCIYILIYTILYLFCFFDHPKIPKKQKKHILFFLILIFTLFRGFRWETGTDWEQYYQVFQDIDLQNFYYYERAGTAEKMELLYAFINAFIKALGGNYTVFLLLTNLFCLISYYNICINFSKYPIIAFASILCSINFFPVRQDIAIAILLFSYKYIVERKLLKFTLIILLAQLIHNSSILFFPLYFFINTKINVKKMTIFTIGSILMGKIAEVVITTLIPILTGLPSSMYMKLMHYSGIEEVTEDLPTHTLSSIIMIYIFLLISCKYAHSTLVHQMPPKKQRYIQLFFIATIFFYCIKFMFTGNLVYFARLSGAFSIVGSVILVDGIALSIKNWNNKYPGFFISFKWMIILFFIYRFYRLTQVFPEAVFPYKSCF